MEPSSSFACRADVKRSRQRIQAPSSTIELASFLGKFPPFDGMPEDDVLAVAAAVEIRSYREGETVLVEDGSPAEAMFVVRAGSMELRHEEELIDVLEPGEAFGHPSLLSGMAPAFTVRAHEDSVCYLLPREEALRALGSPAGAGYVAATLRERLTRTGHTVHALPELGTIRVEELIGRPPVFCEGGTTISRAARIMTEHDTSAILVRDGARLEILTDAALRTRVVAGELSAENPVSRVTMPAITVTPDRLAVDAVVDMLDAGVEHLVVVGATGRDVLGVVSAADLVGLEARSPFALRHAVLRARDEHELVEAAGKLRQLFMALLDAGVAPADVGRVLSLQLDSFTVRLVDLSLARLGAAPTSWAWLALGSAARREFTLGSDQENALAYADPDSAGGEERSAIDGYFARLAEDVNRGLARCGFVADANGVVARNPLWRMSESEWVRVFQDCLESPDRSHLIRANVAFDFRQTSGGLDAASPLVTVMRRAKDHPDFLRRLARAATDLRPPLGLRGSLVTERSAGTLDLKRGGAIPIANLARFHALSNGITISGTLDRLVAAEEVGALDEAAGAALREAFGVVARARLEHHARQLQAGEEPDNLVDPGTLTPLARAQLREAFRAIAHAQKRLSVYVPLGL